GEYGPAIVRVELATGVFGRFAPGDDLEVWASHGDRLAELPAGVSRIGSSDGAPVAAPANVGRENYAAPVHPRVGHTKRGKAILEAFLFDVAGLSPTWTPASIIEESVAAVRAAVGPDGRAVLGLSGGVDSSVAAILCQRALGDRLVCIFVDNGLL